MEISRISSIGAVPGGLLSVLFPAVSIPGSLPTCALLCSVPFVLALPSRQMVGPSLSDGMPGMRELLSLRVP
jgi:hypothetical protein